MRRTRAQHEVPVRLDSSRAPCGSSKAAGALQHPLGGDPLRYNLGQFPVSHCMAVVSSEIATAILELRSAALMMIAVVLKTADLDALAVELEQRASVMPGLFEDEPVAIDLSRLREADEPVDFAGLIALMRRHRMVPLAVRGGSVEQMAAAFAAGLVEAPEGIRPMRAQPVAANTRAAGRDDRAHRRGAGARSAADDHRPAAALGPAGVCP
jgi:hypothetical protein